MVVLRVSIDALSKRGEALTLKDCACIGLKASEHWNGERIADELNAIFAKSGCPAAVLKDGGYDLKRGVSIWKEISSAKSIPCIDDIGHIVANGLKADFSELHGFKSFLKKLKRGASKLRQSELSFLTPPKIRTKGRFMGIAKLARWADAVAKEEKQELIKKRVKQLESAAMDMQKYFHFQLGATFKLATPIVDVVEYSVSEAEIGLGKSLKKKKANIRLNIYEAFSNHVDDHYSELFIKKNYIFFGYTESKVWSLFGGWGKVHATTQIFDNPLKYAQLAGPTHEMGHALGLEHFDKTLTCLQKAGITEYNGKTNFSIMWQTDDGGDRSRARHINDYVLLPIEKEMLKDPKHRAKQCLLTLLHRPHPSIYLRWPIN